MSSKNSCIPKHKHSNLNEHAASEHRKLVPVPMPVPDELDWRTRVRGISGLETLRPRSRGPLFGSSGSAAGFPSTRPAPSPQLSRRTSLEIHPKGGTRGIFATFRGLELTGNHYILD